MCWLYVKRQSQWAFTACFVSFRPFSLHSPTFSFVLCVSCADSSSISGPAEGTVRHAWRAVCHSIGQQWRAQADAETDLLSGDTIQLRNTDDSGVTQLVEEKTTTRILKQLNLKKQHVISKLEQRQLQNNDCFQTVFTDSSAPKLSSFWATEERWQSHCSTLDEVKQPITDLKCLWTHRKLFEHTYKYTSPLTTNHYSTKINKQWPKSATDGCFQF